MRDYGLDRSVDELRDEVHALNRERFDLQGKLLKLQERLELSESEVEKRNEQIAELRGDLRRAELYEEEVASCIHEYLRVHGHVTHENDCPFQACLSASYRTEVLRFAKVPE